MKKLHLVMTVALTAGFLTACQSTAGVPKESTESAISESEADTTDQTSDDDMIPSEIPTTAEISETKSSETEISEEVTAETISSETTVQETERRKPLITIDENPNLYESTRGFYKQKAVVKDKATGNYGFIDSDWNYIIEPQFYDAYNFSEDLAAVNVKGLWGFIDTNGGMVIEPQYKEVGKRFHNIPVRGFVDGYAVVKDKTNDWVLIDKANSVIETIDYTGNYVWGENYVTHLSFNGLYDTMYHERSSESHKIDGIYDKYGIYGENYLVTYSSENGYRIINVNGDTVLQLKDLPEIANISNLSVGCSDKYVFVKAKVNSYTSTYIYDISGNFLGEFEYTEVWPLGDSDYLAAVPVNQPRAAHVIDREGNIILKARNNRNLAYLGYNKISFNALDVPKDSYRIYDIVTDETIPLSNDVGPADAIYYSYHENYIIRVKSNLTGYVFDKHGELLYTSPGMISESVSSSIDDGIIPYRIDYNTFSFFKVCEN